MKRIRLFRFILVSLWMIVSSAAVHSAESKNATGSWKVVVANAPVEYSTSTMVISESEGKYTVKVIFGGSYALNATDVSLHEDVLKFSVDVEGSKVPFEGKISGNRISGAVLSPDGELAVIAEKITLTGTWAYKVPDAPVEYSAGKIVFTELDGKPVAKIILPNEMVIPVSDLKATDSSFTFTMYLESETITVSGGISDGKVVGKSSTPQGEMMFTAIRMD